MLENDWERIQMQTNWKLEHCTAPNSQLSTSNGNTGTSNSPENCSTNSTSDAASSGATVVTSPNQAGNSKTVSTDVNSASPSDSQDKPSNATAQGSEPQQSTGSFFILDHDQSEET